MLENPVLSGIYRSAAAVALASNPKEQNGRIRPSPGANNLTKAAPSDSDYSRGAVELKTA
jgi:hypothetical protein